jgi:nucleoside triphosphate diphosphatase
MSNPDISTLLEIMGRLRDPVGGCPWDIEQTFATIAPYTIEEAYEVAGAIEDEDWPALKDELGDFLFQVVFHAQMAKEQNLFDFGDVVGAIVDKMIRRHPHVFADHAGIETAEAQTLAWEEHKKKERAAKAQGLLDDLRMPPSSKKSWATCSLPSPTSRDI